HTRDLRREFALALHPRPEIAGCAHVHQEEERELAFFDELLHKGTARARGHVPVDRAHFVAGQVFADGVKAHPTAFEDAVVMAGERIGNETPGANLNLANLLEYFARLIGVHEQHGDWA